MESDVRFFRRRANEEFAAAGRAVTEAARERRLILAEAFLGRLKAVEAHAAAVSAIDTRMPHERPAMDWSARA